MNFDWIELDSRRPIEIARVSNRTNLIARRRLQTVWGWIRKKQWQHIPLWPSCYYVCMRVVEGEILLLSWPIPRVRMDPTILNLKLGMVWNYIRSHISGRQRTSVYHQSNQWNWDWKQWHFWLFGRSIQLVTAGPCTKDVPQWPATPEEFWLQTILAEVRYLIFISNEHWPRRPTVFGLISLTTMTNWGLM